MASVGYSRALSDSSRDWYQNCVRAEKAGVSSLLSADIPGRDGFVDAALAVAATDHVPLGIGVALPTRSPLQTVLAAATIASFGRTFALGLGIGTPTTNEHAHGVGYRPSLGRLRYFTECVLGVLRGPAGEPVEVVTKHYRAAFAGFGLDRGLVPVVIGAQDPRTVRWAARATDGLVMHLMTARRVMRNRVSIVGEVRDTAAPFHLSTGMVVSVHPDEEESLRRARADVAAAMSRPWYMGRLADAAGEELRDEFAALVARELWTEAGLLLPDELVRDFVLVSTPDRVREDLEAVDEVEEVVPVNCGNLYSHMPEAFGLTHDDARTARAELCNAILGDPRQ